MYLCRTEKFGGPHPNHRIFVVQELLGMRSKGFSLLAMQGRADARPVTLPWVLGLHCHGQFFLCFRKRDQSKIGNIHELSNLPDMFFAERDPIFQGMGNHMTLGIKAQVVDPLDLRGHSSAHIEKNFAVSRVLRKIVHLMGVLGKIEQLFRGAGFEKLPLAGVEFARLVQVPPFGKGKHPVTVVVLQPVRIETLIIPDVFPLSLAEGSYQVVLLVEAVSVTERLVPGGKFLGRRPFAKEGRTVHFFRNG